MTKTSETPKPPKSSAQEVLAALAEIKRSVAVLTNPEPLYFFKPMKSGSGAAVKFDTRLTPILNAKGFIGEVDGGCYLELVAQSGTDDAGNPTFGWQDVQTRITTKLGLPDISALLLGIRAARHHRKLVPEGIRPRSKKDGAWTVDPVGATIGMTHKFNDDTTIIQYKFGKDGSFLSVSKSATLRRSIKISLAEEVLLEAYLEMALRAFLYVGKR